MMHSMSVEPLMEKVSIDNETYGLLDKTGIIMMTEGGPSYGEGSLRGDNFSIGIYYEKSYRDNDVINMRIRISRPEDTKKFKLLIDKRKKKALIEP